MGNWVIIADGLVRMSSYRSRAGPQSSMTCVLLRREELQERLCDEEIGTGVMLHKLRVVSTARSHQSWSWEESPPPEAWREQRHLDYRLWWRQ